MNIKARCVTTCFSFRLFDSYWLYYCCCCLLPLRLFDSCFRH